MTTYRRTITLVTISFVVVAVLASAGIPLAAAQTDTDQPAGRRSTLELARERLDDARRQATDAAERLADAETRRANLSQEISAAEEEIPLLRAHADDLRRMVRERAAAPLRSELHAPTRPGHEHQDRGRRRPSGPPHLDDRRPRGVRRHRPPGDGPNAGGAAGAAARAARRPRPVHRGDHHAARRPRRARLERASAAYDHVRSALAVGATRPDVATGAGVCPVQGFVVFTDDFGEPREGGVVHQGIDMPSKEGTPVVAVVDGVLAPRRQRRAAATARGCAAATTSPTTTRTSRATRVSAAAGREGRRRHRLRGFHRRLDRSPPPLRGASDRAVRRSTATRCCSVSVPTRRCGPRSNVDRAPGWRNRQTRSAQNRLSSRTCGFESHSGHRDRLTNTDGPPGHRGFESHSGHWHRVIGGDR